MKKFPNCQEFFGPIGTSLGLMSGAKWLQPWSWQIKQTLLGRRFDISRMVLLQESIYQRLHIPVKSRFP
jgi:hypothetical protein